jgi:cystathionine beta-lyase/cystathionine gamma-synthase
MSREHDPGSASLAQTDGFATRAIHVGQDPDPGTGAVIVPIYQTSTYAQSEVGVHKGYDYSRTANPTRAALEACIASLDNGRYALAFASGMAAEDTVMHLLETGSHVVVADDVYRGITFHVCRCNAHRKRYERDRRPDAADLAREPDQPAPQTGGHRRRLARRTCAQRAGCGR